MHFPERSASHCALIPKVLVSCLQVVGPGRPTASLTPVSITSLGKI